MDITSDHLEMESNFYRHFTRTLSLLAFLRLECLLLFSRTAAISDVPYLPNTLYIRVPEQYVSASGRTNTEPEAVGRIFIFAERARGIVFALFLRCLYVPVTKPYIVYYTYCMCWHTLKGARISYETESE